MPRVVEVNAPTWKYSEYKRNNPRRRPWQTRYRRARSPSAPRLLGRDHRRRKMAANHCRGPGARKEAGLNCLSLNISPIARGSGRVRAPDCRAPASRSDFAAGLIHLSLYMFGGAAGSGCGAGLILTEVLPAPAPPVTVTLPDVWASVDVLVGLLTSVRVDVGLLTSVLDDVELLFPVDGEIALSFPIGGDVELSPVDGDCELSFNVPLPVVGDCGLPLPVAASAGVGVEV
jgi:hypothetical protein